MRTIAHRLGVEVEPVTLPAGVLGVACRSERAVLYHPSGYAPRDEFTLAHELIELHLPRAAIEAMPSQQKERFCDRAAAALLLPLAAFAVSVAMCGRDVEQLRAQWPLASAKVIASRLLELL